MTAYNTHKILEGPEPTKIKIPLPVHLACILLLVAVTVCTGPLAAYFA